jgi:alginate O-acetyltransferase complex protein AlgI
MLFNSHIFLFAFLPLTYLVFWRLKTRSRRYLWLTATGYAFYAFWNWRFCAVMALSTVVAFLSGLAMARCSGWRRRLCVVVPVVVDLSLLGFFKYANFALDTAGQLFSIFGWTFTAPRLDVVLPVGISFYTFHTITYVVDCYRGVIKPTRDLFEFTTYVSFFAQLVAGPIVRFAQIEHDLEHLDEADRSALRESGWSLFAIGLFKKLLIADVIAGEIDPLLAAHAQLSTPAMWLVMLGYTYQLYFDFSGYSDMAVGLGRLFGLRLPQNFNSPYRALDISDFWRRWHISLSSVMRDYVYIPLEEGHRGSVDLPPGARAARSEGRLGRELRTARSTLVTMLLCGLWHGANFTFVLWGAYHGALLVLQRLFARPFGKVPPGLRRAITFLLVVLGWVLFRAENVGRALSIWRQMFVWQPGPFAPSSTLLGAVVIAGLIAHLAPNTFQIRHEWRPGVALGMAALFAACLALMYSGIASPFLYFQF